MARVLVMARSYTSAVGALTVAVAATVAGCREVAMVADAMSPPPDEIVKTGERTTSAKNVAVEVDDLSDTSAIARSGGSGRPCHRGSWQWG